MFKKIGSLVIALSVLHLSTPKLYAVINAGLQPYDLMQYRYTHVLALTINQVDQKDTKIVAHVAQSFKGTFVVDTSITLSFVGPLKQALADTCFQPGRSMVAFVGRKRRSRELMVYADGFYLGQMTDNNTWILDRSSEQTVGMDGQTIGTLAGTWNGATDQLIRLLQDISEERDHFPRKAYARFKPDILIDKLDQPITGLGLYDIEGDGDEDIIACSPAGDRAYLQIAPLRFVDTTKGLALDSTSTSCSLADFNGDFLSDLLVGGVLYQGTFSDNRFRFSKTNLLPANFNNLKCTAFVELNGDGFPDIMASIIGQGLRAFINQEGVSFKEVTADMNLDQPVCGAGKTGFFAAGDWNGDRRSDIFYAAGPGYLLVKDRQGIFKPIEHNIAFKFTVGLQDEPGQTGAGVFLPLLSPERMDLVIPLEDGWLTIANHRGKPVDITPWGNEISEGSNDHLATIAADLNLDGHIDFYTISSATNGHNRFIINRGYGSFMLATVHKHFGRMFDGPTHEQGGTAAAIGDIDDDGAPDLIIGNSRGHLTIILNDTLATRNPIPHATREIAVLQETRLLSVRVLGSKGVVNARIQLFDANKFLIARCDLGTNIGSGCCGPNRVTMAVRQPGYYQLRVTYADGLERNQTIDLKTNKRLSVNVDRGAEDKNNVW
jgi:hypothetical protein